MHEHVAAVYELYEAVREIHRKLPVLASGYSQRIGDIEDLTGGEWSLPTLADLGAVHNEIHKLAKEISAEANSRAEFIARVLSYRSIMKATASNNPETTVRGEISTATPRTLPAPILPKPGTEEHRKLAEYFGIDEDLLKKRLVTFHWKHLSDDLAEREARGENVPPGVETRTQWKCTFRLRLKSLSDD